MSMDNINSLCQIVKRHPSIEILGLCKCKGEDANGYEMMKQVMLLEKQSSILLIYRKIVF